MPLRRKVDDVPRIHQFSTFVDMHSSGLYLAFLASPLIGVKHIWILLLKLESDAFAHHAFSVYGINERFSGGFKQIACDYFQHRNRLKLVVVPIRSDRSLRLMIAALNLGLGGFIV